MCKPAVCCALMISLAGVLNMASAESMEVQGGVDWYFPSGDLWDQAMGAEFKIIEWYESGGGVAFAIGMAQWTADESSRVTLPWNGSVGQSRAWKGDAKYIPLGLSAMYRGDTTRGYNSKYSVEMEAGFRYLMANSSLSLQKRSDVWSSPSSVSTTYTSYDADLDNSWVGRLGMSLAWEWGDQSRVLTSAGYQFDLSKGKVTASGASVQEDVEMSAFFLQLGIAFLF